MTEQTALSPRTLAAIRAVDRAAVFIAQHWLLLAASFLFLFSTLPFVAPLLAVNGFEGPAQIIYTAYAFTCHQLAYRSFFLSGQQLAYSVGDLQSLLHVSNAATDVFYWRGIQGSTILGYKVAYCERDVAIYSSMFLASLVYAVVRSRLPRLNWRVYVAFGIVPILVDGGTQLVMLRESDPFLRVITGVLFGVLTVWLIYPYVDEAMRDTFEQSSRQLARVNQRMAGSR
ncbi:MAG: DUF2085 domain-containing protein [Rudaea sp.]